MTYNISAIKPGPAGQRGTRVHIGYFTAGNSRQACASARRDSPENYRDYRAARITEPPLPEWAVAYTDHSGVRVTPYHGVGSIVAAKAMRATYYDGVVIRHHTMAQGSKYSVDHGTTWHATELEASNQETLL